MTCDRDRIYALVENPAATDVATEAHLSACPECMELYGSVVEFTAGLGDPGVWGADVVPIAPFVETTVGLDLLVAESLRLDEERARGLDVVATLLALPVDAWHAWLRGVEGVCTVGLVEALLGEGRKRQSDPREFERIADLAIEVSEALDPRSYPKGMVARARGNAWKDRANALRIRGEFQDALWALDEAERHYQQQPVPEFDLATADYVRATILVETDRVAECITLADHAARTFLDYGDVHRQIQAKMIEAGALYNLGRKRESREISLSLLKPLQEIGESKTLAMVFLNIAQISVDLNDTDMASIYFLQAAPLFREFGMLSDEAKARWGLGRLLVTRGRFEEALDRLRAARADLEALGLMGDASLITLDLAEVLLALGRSAEVTLTCRSLVQRFTKAGSNERALRALSYLQEAAEAGNASTELVRYVRQYVAEAPRQPQLLFLPPPE
jgi:tetratricopeptide (TPR) repeat protein